MTVVNKEQYNNGKYNYMLFKEDGLYATVDTEGGRSRLRVNNYIVNADGSKAIYKRIGYKNANFETRATYVEGGDNAAYVKAYVTDTNGNPINWRGTMFFEDIDSDESISIQSSCIEKVMHLGKNVKQTSDSFNKETSGQPYATTYTVFKNSTGSACDTDASFTAHAVCILANIPKEGMWIRRRYGTVGAYMKSKTWVPDSGVYTPSKFTDEGSAGWKSIP